MNIKPLLTAISLLAAGTAMAVPAKPGLIDMAQPDGTVIKVRLVGDEHFHYYTDEAGRILIPDASGALRQADSSETAAATRRKAPGRAPSKYTSYPTTGRQKALVVMVQFSDNSFTYGHDYFQRMLNETGYNDFGSARDYYVENSGGNFLPDFDVYGPVTLAHPMTYYSANDDARAYEMVVEACRALDGEVNFADYDRDGDGWVDNVYVFYAGYGEADGGGANTVWPHSSNVYRKGSTLLLDGVQIGQYACSNELIANSRTLVGIGTFCHEFGHVLGLPDLYSTTDSSIVTPGYWSLMDHGNYANNGRCPVALTAYERYFLGWCEPLTLSGAASVRLPSVDRNIGLRINGSDAEEYFILEYRRKSGWDSYAPGAGLLVWHIDYDRDAWNMNTVNNYESQQRVRILPADGTLTVIGDGGDPYPGTAGVTSIADFKSWNGASAGIAISGISANGDYVTFSVNGGASQPATPAVEISGITDCEATVALGATTSALLSLSYVDEGRTRYVPGYTFRANGGIPTELAELTPDTEYTLEAYAADGASLSTPARKTFTTDAPGIRFYAPQNLEAHNIGATAFTASWEALPFATDYLLTVSHEAEGDAAEAVVDFSDKTNLPEGWTTTAGNTMSVSGYYGAAAPSLRMANNAEMIESPVFAEPVKSLSFWMRGYQAGTASALNIHGLVGGEWTLLATVSGIDNTKGTTFAYTDELRGATALRLSYSSAGGSLCIDDIRVGLGNATVTVKDLDSQNVGDVTSYEVKGLQQGVTYSFYVTATDGVHTSLASETKTVTTGGADSIDGIDADDTAAPAEIYDLMGNPRGTNLEALPSGIYLVGRKLVYR